MQTKRITHKETQNNYHHLKPLPSLNNKTWALIPFFSSKKIENHCHHLLVLFLCFHFLTLFCTSTYFLVNSPCTPETSQDGFLLLGKVLAAMSIGSSEWCEVITQASLRDGCLLKTLLSALRDAAAACESCSLFTCFMKTCFPARHHISGHRTAGNQRTPTTVRALKWTVDIWT